MKPKSLYIQPSQVDTARRILARQAWICSNCGLKRTFHRVSRTHDCRYSSRFAYSGIWRKADFGGRLHIAVLLADREFSLTDYLITTRGGTVVIKTKAPQPFDMTTPNRSRSKQYANSLPSL